MAIDRRDDRRDDVEVATEQADLLATLSEAVLAVAAQRSVDATLQTIVDVAGRLGRARYAALGVPDEEGAFARFLTSGVSDDQWRAIGPAPRQHGLLGEMLRRTTPYRVADIRRDPHFEGWPSSHPMLASFLGVPIVGDGEVLGALWLANRKDRNAFTQNDERLIVLLAAHAAIALENARLYERSRELSVVEERNRIARELHDAVAQKLFSVRLTAQAAAALVRRDPERAVDEVSRVGELAGEALAELRSVVVELRPADLEEGLAVALRKHVEVLDRVHAAEVRWTGSDLAPLPAAVEDALLRVAQEALHNALRHGKPCLVEVILRDEAGAVVLEVRDDGVGFAVEEERRGSRRLGLASMSERAESVGGRLTVASQPMAGTTVRLEVRRG